MKQNKTHLPHFREQEPIPEALQKAAQIAISEALKVQQEEKVLIVTNPDHEVSLIARALYDSALDAGGRPVLMYQPVKTQLDFAEELVLAAFQAKPEVFISLSAEKLGKDRQGIAHPYEHEGIQFDHIFHLQMYGEKTCRAFWSPSTTLESFIRTVPIDYSILSRRCAKIKEVLDAAVAVHITAPAGTDITLGLKGRQARLDDGDFSRPGTGGNLPAGETFISPENDTAQGVIVFDGSISLHQGDILIHSPIRCQVERGYITSIEGGEEAALLRETIQLAEYNAYEYEKTGKLAPGNGATYAKNARNIGELGIGLNPAAHISGNMLEDEKAFHTCHFAIGHNYDEDAPALIHLDGLVRDPTIVATMADGKTVTIEIKGELQKEFL
ncbi:MAG TPA: aminopeptidase [Termitinemataceae bacterium]|jgi:leucyl aminopeptidase (aminopeptidase T)|uniref:aminopeptidase n=1 Tax=Treponema sp. J25 TaxID=2094121 RepID=UPI001053E3FE|nr:aminopeptidase [Treponema sp. J25]HOK00015.1 aminopeptidase [Termitinemataceae bacterium]HOM24229.1 aminopeptidase [Termitinemataceae bacterium]HPQ01306.1 aminopeptidase [Termitinemataceae bacterium]